MHYTFNSWGGDVILNRHLNIIITLVFLALFISPVLADVKSSPQIVTAGSFLAPEGQKGQLLKASDGSLISVTFNGTLYSNLSLIVRQKYDDSTGWYLRGKFTTNAFNNPKHFSCGIYYNTTVTDDQVFCAWSDAESIIYFQKYDVSSHIFGTRTTVASAGDWRNVGVAINESNAFFVAYVASSDTTVKIRQSTDAGATWSGASTYTKTSAQTINLALFIDLWNNLHICTADKLAGDLYNITYSNSTITGTSWMSPVVVSQSPFANSGAICDVFVNAQGNKTVSYSGNPNWVSDPTTSTMLWITTSAPNTNTWTTPINITTNITEGADTPFMIADYYGNQYIFYTDAFTTYNNNKCRYVKNPAGTSTWLPNALESTCRYPIPIGATWGSGSNRWNNITQIDLIYSNTTSSNYYFMNQNLTDLSSIMTISNLTIQSPVSTGKSSNISYHINLDYSMVPFVRIVGLTTSVTWELVLLLPDDYKNGTKQTIIPSAYIPFSGMYSITLVACQSGSYSSLSYNSSLEYSNFNGINCDEESGLITTTASLVNATNGTVSVNSTFRIYILPIDVSGYWSLPGSCYLNGYYQETQLANLSSVGELQYYNSGGTGAINNPTTGTIGNYMYGKILYMCIYDFGLGIESISNLSFSFYPRQSEIYQPSTDWRFSASITSPPFLFYIYPRSGCQKIIETNTYEECKELTNTYLPSGWSWYCALDQTRCSEYVEDEVAQATICTRWGRYVGYQCETFTDIPFAYRDYVNGSSPPVSNTTQPGEFSDDVGEQTGAFFGVSSESAKAFWALVISLGFVIITAILLSTKTNMGASIGQVVAILFLGFLIMFTMIGWFPWWILLLLGVVVVMIITKWMVPHFGGG